MAVPIGATIIREEEYLVGKPVSIYGDVCVPMTRESMDGVSGDPFHLDGDTWRIQWWSGYGQPPTVDIYVVRESDKDNLEENAFCIGHLYSQAEFDEAVSRLREGQWDWLYKTMGYDNE